MDTRYHIDIDRLIEEMEADLTSSATAEERYWTAFSLARLIAERDAECARIRASLDWDQLPF